jgi:hypothetical protein
VKTVNTSALLSTCNFPTKQQCTYRLSTLTATSYQPSPAASKTTNRTTDPLAKRQVAYVSPRLWGPQQHPLRYPLAYRYSDILSLTIRLTGGVNRHGVRSGRKTVSVRRGSVAHDGLDKFEGAFKGAYRDESASCFFHSRQRRLVLIVSLGLVSTADGSSRSPSHHSVGMYSTADIGSRQENEPHPNLHMYPTERELLIVNIVLPGAHCLTTRIEHSLDWHRSDLGQGNGR